MTMAPAFPWLVWAPRRPGRRSGADHGTAPAKRADAHPVGRACEPLPLLEAIHGRRRHRPWFEVTPWAPNQGHR
jgi:hypothetical protein